MGTPESSRPARLRVGVVGAGRVGSTLGAALARSGHDITGVVAVSAASRARAERLLPQASVLPTDEVVAGADLVLLAVPDDALRPLVAGLAETDAWRAGQLVAHTSGAQGIGVLDPAAARGVVPLALHPVMTFVGRPEDLDRLDGAPFGVTADDDLRPVAESLVLEMGGEPVWVPESARPLYHAALSVGSNHLVTLIADALALLDGAGVERSDQLLAPLVSAALDNVLRLRDGALTGPVSRGDVATVAAHLRTLQAAAPDVLPSYRAMARRTAERARDAGRLDGTQFAAVIEVLDA
ncbi:MAG TPA: DUF2520 domain-containing protein [Jatrophihabitantaceae bacterium]|jgi:predicted short-subunit dehydrogenase-like oxidoreductase (DUF2520 family)|nr:DUF2520 domain-containing protein [Jatrophihabitantaceae bacterium]